MLIKRRLIVCRFFLKVSVDWDFSVVMNLYMKCLVVRYRIFWLLVCDFVVIVCIRWVLLSFIEVWR